MRSGEALQPLVVPHTGAAFSLRQRAVVDAVAAPLVVAADADADACDGPQVCCHVVRGHEHVRVGVQLREEQSQLRRRVKQGARAGQGGTVEDDDARECLRWAHADALTHSQTTSRTHTHSYTHSAAVETTQEPLSSPIHTGNTRAHHINRGFSATNIRTDLHPLLRVQPRHGGSGCCLRCWFGHLGSAAACQRCRRSGLCLLLMLAEQRRLSRLLVLVLVVAARRAGKNVNAATPVDVHTIERPSSRRWCVPSGVG